jgi:hypothetical protein
MPKKSDATTKVSKAPRGAGFSRKETADLLKLIGTVLPIGGLEWDYIYKKHLMKHADKNRTLYTIKQKFGRLHRTKVQTGTSLPDPLVQKAKIIQWAILNKFELSDGEGAEPAETEVENEEEMEVEAFEVLAEDAVLVDTTDVAVAMASAPDDTDNVSTGSNSTDTEKHIRIIWSEIQRPDPSGTLAGVGITLPTPRVIRNDSEEEKAIDEIVDVSDDESEPKKKKSTSNDSKNSTIKPFTGACVRLGSRKPDTKKPADAFGGTEMTAFLQYMMMQQAEETRARREEIKEYRQ